MWPVCEGSPTSTLALPQAWVFKRYIQRLWTWSCCLRDDFGGLRQNRGHQMPTKIKKKHGKLRKTKQLPQLGSVLSLCKNAHGRGRRNGTCVSICQNLSSTDATLNAKHVWPVWHKIWRTRKSTAAGNAWNFLALQDQPRAHHILSIATPSASRLGFRLRRR